MVRPRGVRLAPMIVIYITIELLSVQGRKCVCTSKACLAAGVDTCKTRFACYTELILTDEGRGSTTTRGCTENATPLLCENRPRSDPLDSKRMINGNNINDNSTNRPTRVRWPYLRCCNSADYCNSDRVLDPWKDPRHKPTLILPQNQEPGVSSTASGSPESDSRSEESISDTPDPRNRDKKLLDPSAFTGDGNNAGLNSLTLSNVKPLHVATLVLAVAALISVLAACYVVTGYVNLIYSIYIH